MSDTGCSGPAAESIREATAQALLNLVQADAVLLVTFCDCGRTAIVLAGQQEADPERLARAREARDAVRAILSRHGGVLN